MPPKKRARDEPPADPLAPEPHASTLASVAACCATPRDAYGVFSTSEEGAAHGDVVSWVANVRNIAL